MCIPTSPADIAAAATKDAPSPKAAAAPKAAAGGLRYPLTNQQQEYVLVLGLLVAGFATDRFDNPGAAVRLRHVAVYYFAAACVRHAYHEYLEWAYFAFPEKRTQKDAKVREGRDLMGRTDDEQELIEWHDRLTALSTFALLVGGYVAWGEKLYVDVAPRPDIPAYWMLRVLAHHYALSFGMYWAHRYLHVNTFLWRHVHSLHHYAKTPLARTTYMDHWFDNFFNAVISEFAALLVAPLPFGLLVASRLFRICESLEKHSGLSGWLNLVHSAQQVLPFAQMPHHHDWHHEGHKGSNYTFASLGGLWDVLFETRHQGRAAGHAAPGATRRDAFQIATGKRRPRIKWDHPLVTPLPLLAFFAAAAARWRALGACGAA